MTDNNRSTSIEQCITDITECSICHDVLHDNRCLPCLHTFCLKCLESYRKGKPKGKPLPCPVCRREFSIPKSVSDLPRNFFIEKLIEAHNIKEQNTLPKLCDICSEDTKAVQAERFCSECRQYLCLSCEKQHKKIKATTSHKTIDSTNVSDPPELAPRPIYCCVHTTKEAEVYCQDCKMVICWQCKSMSHSRHVSIEISCGAKELATKLEEHIEELSERLRTKQNEIQTLTQREKLYTEEIDAESSNICNEISRLYRSMTDNGDKLKKALNTSTVVHLNELQALRGKLETTVNELKKHKVYIEQMIHLGNISDLCEYTDKLISKTASVAEESTCEIVIPPVTHLSESDLQDLLTGKRTDIDLQYCDRCMDNANRSNDSTIQLQKDVPPTGESKRSFKEGRKGIGQANFRPTGRRETRETRETKRYNNLPENIKERPRSRSVSRSRSRDKGDKYTRKAARCKSADDLAEELSGSEDTTTLKLEVAIDDTSDTAVKNPCNHPGIKETTDAESPPVSVCCKQCCAVTRNRRVVMQWRRY